ncbi:secretory lipase-domain-containing protein [Dichotomopilus funicola]|uniref:Secretory lipase-domain-containing protein n=1 Tax=Dichotomopilus funicola TaxID=1934379 RepID=A0AAN6V7Y3_9PEZI|nr:secretory lipase-domain-containing protein [Dichotomopilus funicola]
MIPLPISLTLLGSALLLSNLTTAEPTPGPPPITQLLAESNATSNTVASLLPPTLDPWYRAPTTYDWAATEPGTVLKIRRAPQLIAAPVPLIPNALAAYHLLYRSTDSRYNPSWAVTTLFVPRSQAPPLLSYQLPYDTCNPNASPSFALALSSLTGDPYGDITSALSLGWLVAVPDYEGPLASYSAGVQAGHATLDGVRAVLAVGEGLGLGLGGMEKTKVALWGYSGGALASEWAAELSVQYAPKLGESLAGVALGGLTPNVTSVTGYLNRKKGAGLIPQGLLGMASQHPEAYEWIVGRLKPGTGRERFLSVRGMTGAQAVRAFEYEDIYGYFVGGEGDLYVPVMKGMYDVDGYMGYHGVPGMPVFVYNAVNDELSDVRDVDALVERFCGVGANILYQRNWVGSHEEELVNGRGRAFRWLRSVLDGSYGELYGTMGCTVQNVTYNIMPWADKSTSGNDGE